MTNKKSYFMTFILIILSILIIAVIPNFSLASNPIDNPDAYKPGNASDSDVTALTNKASPVLSAISILGAVIAVITLMVIGIKYMVGSVSEKAEYKKTMFSYLIGAVLILGISGILQLINNLVVPLFN